MKLVAMMLTYNDESRFLRQVLDRVTPYVDEIVVLDDGSWDGSVEMARGYKNAVVHKNESSVYRAQGCKKVRTQLYSLTLERNPDWILSIDSDWIFERKFEGEVRQMLDTDYNCFQFYFCNMWDEAHFVIPASSMKATRFLFRLEKDKPQAFGNMILHCGSTPGYVLNEPNCLETDIRIQHLGFIRREDRLARIKINEEFANTPGNSGWMSRVKQYRGWEEKSPKLEEWIER